MYSKTLSKDFTCVFQVFHSPTKQLPYLSPLTMRKLWAQGGLLAQGHTSGTGTLMSIGNPRCLTPKPVLNHHLADFVVITVKLMSLIPCKWRCCGPWGAQSSLLTLTSQQKLLLSSLFARRDGCGARRIDTACSERWKYWIGRYTNKHNWLMSVCILDGRPTILHP